MSVPFSNTHLRVPRGFGTVLEGLTREVLRDQPQDIPQYAATYFDALLKQREESGMDPAEWAAKLEDRFYNNHAFNTAEDEAGQQTAAEVTASQEKTHESQTEDESRTSAEGLSLSSTQPEVSEKAHSTESTDEEDKQSVTEKNTAETGNAEEESVNRFPTSGVQSDEPSGTDEERDPTTTALAQVDRTANETDSSSVPVQNIPQSEDEPTDLLSVERISGVDVCAEELGAAEEEGGDEQATAVEDTEFVNSDGEGNNEGAEPSETLSHPGFADVDVCASELGGTERTTEGGCTEVDTHVLEEVKSVKPQPEATAGETSLSQREMPESNQQEVEDGAGNTREEERTETEAPSGQTHESLPHIEGDFDCNVTPKEDTLVEISFEDVPEAQHIAEVVQSELSEMQQKEEPKEFTASTIDRNVSDAQEYHDLELERVKKEVDSAGEKVESLHNSFHKEKEEKEVTNDSNFNYSEDDEKRITTESISSEDQHTTEREKENQEDKTVQKTEDNENKLHQDEESEFKEDQMTDSLKADKEEPYKEGYMEMEDQEINDGGAGNNSSQATQSSTSVAPLEAEREKFEESAQDPAEEEEGGPPGESQPGDPEEEKEATSKEAEEVTEEGEEEADSEVQETSDAVHPEEKVSLWTAADHQAESEENPTELESEECSRPQEEEDIMDIPLDDPEANRAAAKIQAGFRGHMTRKKMKPEDKAEGEEVSSTGDVPNSSQGDSETGRSGAVESDDTSVPQQ